MSWPMPGTPREMPKVQPSVTINKPSMPAPSDAMSRRLGAMKIGMDKGK